MPELNYDPGAVALVTALVLASALFFGLYPKEPKQYIPSAYWKAKQYRMHLYACILTCNTMAEWEDLKSCVDGYATREYSDRPSRRTLKRYKRELMDAYNLKSVWLTEHNQMEVVCQN
jgi:hypothetical protein